MYVLLTAYGSRGCQVSHRACTRILPSALCRLCPMFTPKGISLFSRHSMSRVSLSSDRSLQHRCPFHHYKQTSAYIICFNSHCIYVVKELERILSYWKCKYYLGLMDNVGVTCRIGHVQETFLPLCADSAQFLHQNASRSFPAIRCHVSLCLPIDLFNTGVHSIIISKQLYFKSKYMADVPSSSSLYGVCNYINNDE